MGGLGRRWIGILGLSFVLLAFGARDISDGIDRDDCEEHTITHTISPDGAWVATVDQAVCQIAPIGGANILVKVELARAASPFRPTWLLAGETSGYDKDRPHVEWKRCGIELSSTA